MEQLSKNIDLDRIHTKLLNLGLLLNVFVPAILFALGLFLRSQGVGIKPVEGLDILLWVLLAVSAGEILTIYLFKKKILFAQKVLQSKKENISGERIFFTSGLILFSLSLSPAIYGFVYFLLGGTAERFVIFIGITLLCFLLFKPKLEEMKSVKEGLSDLSDER
jgi:hypothetical protein